MRAIGTELAIIAAVAIAAVASGASTAAADTTVKVNTTSDESTVADGTCSLREALLFANGVQGGEDCGSGQPSGTVTILLPAGHDPLTQGCSRWSASTD